MDLAVWGHPAREFPEGHDSYEDMLGWMSKLRDAGITIYMPFVMSGAKAFFDIRSWGNTERDLLGPLMDVAEEVGIEIHPVVGLGKVTPTFEEGQGVYVPAQIEGQEPLAGWTGWACPAWEENVRFLHALCEDLIDTYDCDGVHMDAVRYPNSAVLNSYPCGCERCREMRFEWLGSELPSLEELSLPGFMSIEIQMRESFVRSVAEEFRQICDERHLPLSLAARARYIKDAVPEGQDWAAWCEDGLLDFVAPMSYNPCPERFKRFVDEHMRLVDGTGTPLYAGVGRKSSLGVISPQEMIAQLRYLDEAGVGGACIFHAAALEDEDLTLLREFMAE